MQFGGFFQNPGPDVRALARVQLFRLMVFVQKGIQQDVFAIQLAFHKRRGLVAHEHRMAAAFGHHGLGGIAHIIVIEMGQLAHQLIRQAASGHACFLARHKFQGAVRPNMKNSIGPELFFDILIEGLILIGRQH
ncbi:hypothetical protein D3C75_1086510 [compost metagenome]